ncbi:glycoside hydrolase family 65 protein [Oceanobacillus jeddahense]|uniref:Family 65 glycosyl hydrolase n=1 Tax=Oceanobacillus jeddahense TaxID=1462527 RepID=A0ABY5JM97_9BACI|nr:glycosyl hydrolase family 65 protein [Oceanobacillus jeddahense]UUI01431.1 family 65 glycosyl hydrolase [Oceanobacillus jeddahense]
MTWKIEDNSLDNQQLLVNESLFSLGNGYLGVRGNFEEGYREDYLSIRGIYINGFYDETDIQYGEKLYGFPEKQEKMVNIIDSQEVLIYLDDEAFSLFEGEVIDFSRTLYLEKGYVQRNIHWRSPQGKEVKIQFKRLVSFSTQELFAIEIMIEPIDGIQEVKVISEVEGDVRNFVDDNDPRVASGHAKRLTVREIEEREGFSIIKSKTEVTNLEVSCVSSVFINHQTSHQRTVKETSVSESFTCETGKPIRFTKYNVYTDTRKHGKQLVDKAVEIQKELSIQPFQAIVKQQESYLNAFWELTDIKINGDEEMQRGIRFNLYQLLQSAGKDGLSNIAAKGLSGEGYEGHYFWDTEIYMFPLFLMTQPKIAKSLLLQRYSLLDAARARAKEMGHQQGALYPWRTITGKESSAYFPAGTAQYHISADIAYSFIQYYLVTKDEAFLKEYIAEVLFETARLWIDAGHMRNGKFRIDNVTGPDEYTCIVNNNYYTNSMAKYNLLWAVKVFNQLQDTDVMEEIMVKLHLDKAEVKNWLQAGENMYLPFNEALQINEQDDTFLQKAVWDLESTPKDQFPLLLHYHPLTLYRYQVCKQADTVLAHFLLEDEEDLDIIKNTFDYYENITTHDSSLSYCVHSIMSSKLGYTSKAYDYFSKTALLDLNNTHGNTKDGLHLANMGGTWLAIIFGFCGLRVKENGIHFQPKLPQQWEALSFKLRYQKRILELDLNQEYVIYKLISGENLTIYHNEKEILLEQHETVKYLM